MLVILLLPEALDWSTAVSARGVVVEGIAKRAVKGVSRSCCGGEGMRGGGLERLNYFRTLARPHKLKIPFHMYFGFQKIKRSKRIVFHIVFKANDHRNLCFNFGLVHPNGRQFDLN